MEQSYKYVVIGAGLAGASAVEGIRELDAEGSTLLIGAEKHLPYHRPPLSKKLWQGKKKVEDIFIHDAPYYAAMGVDVVLDTPAVTLDAASKTVALADGGVCGFEKLLLATGGSPAALDIPGGDADGVSYFRYLDDYTAASADVAYANSVLVIGGGFIGSEMAAALHINKVNVAMLFRDPYIGSRLFPRELGLSIQRDYESRGITVLSEDSPAAIERTDDGFVTHTISGKRIESELLIVGVGLKPSVELAEGAGLAVENGIVVNEMLQTSHPDIYAAGDNANFPHAGLGKRSRVEHWDNALNQGKLAGRNMAGAGETYDYIPYFFSDLFDFGYEAVGEVDSSLETFEDWQKPNETGVVYYLREGRVRGVMMCNVWDRVDAARELISGVAAVRPEELEGRIA